MSKEELKRRDHGNCLLARSKEAQIARAILHPDILRKRWRGIVNPQRSSKAHNSLGLKESVEEFVALCGDLVRSLNLTSDFIINIDETMADPKDRPSTSKRMGRAGKQELNVKSHPVSECLSLLICAAVSGSVWMSLKSYPDKEDDSESRQRGMEVEGARYLI